MVANEFWVSFTGCKKRKAWNKAREKMLVKRRQNLAETDRGSYFKVERLQECLDSKGAHKSSTKANWQFCRLQAPGAL